MISFDETLEALFNDAEERVQSTKLLNISYQYQSPSMSRAHSVCEGEADALTPSGGDR